MVAVNRYRPHVLVLPEDDADRQIANGFCLHPSVRARAIQVLPEAGGWANVREQFHRQLVPYLRSYDAAAVVLIVDFDGQLERKDDVLRGLDASLRDRAFVLGALREPEDLRSDLGSFEAIGRKLADDCASDATRTWKHELLLHNADEVARMNLTVRPVVFNLQ